MGNYLLFKVQNAMIINPYKIWASRTRFLFGCSVCSIKNNATKFPIGILVNFGTERRAQIERYHYANGKLFVF